MHTAIFKQRLEGLRSFIFKCIAAIVISSSLFLYFPFTRASVKAATVTWVGGSSNWETGGNWSGGDVPGPDDEVVIDANVIVTINSSTSINSLTLGNDSGITTPTLNFAYDAVDSGALIIDGGDVSIHTGSTVTHTDGVDDTIGGKISIQHLSISGTFFIDGNMNVDAKGYQGAHGAVFNGYGPGAGIGVNANSWGASAGGYGGRGGHGYGVYGRPGEPYGSIADPTDLGSGGGRNLECTLGGDGGGAIVISTLGDLVVEGTISANGESVSNIKCAGGSGGTVNITIGGSLSGNGTIIARGGNGAGTYGGTGGGGRVKISYSSNSFTGSYSSPAGPSPAARIGESGTLIIFDSSTLGLSIEQSQRWVPNVGDTFDSLFGNVNSFTIDDSITLALDSYNKSTVDEGFSWDISVTDFTLPATSKISTDALGYLGGTDAHYNGYGPGGGIGCDADSWGGTGGSHGGKGGGTNYGTSAPDPVGSERYPTDPGSGGGRTKQGIGSPGGGAVKIVADETIEISGELSTDGGSNALDGPGGGAGGSVYLIANSVVCNTGIISADGGDTGGDEAGGGGGGRIAIYSVNEDLTGCTISVSGGIGGYSTGGDGTYITAGIPSYNTLSQYRTDGITTISTGGYTDETTVVVKMNMEDGDNPEDLTPEVEVQEVGTSFTDTSTHAGTQVAYSGTPVEGEVTVDSLLEGSSYHWQTRVCDDDTNCTDWVSYGGNGEGEADFIIDGTDPTDPVDITSSSHNPMVWSNDNTIVLTWTAGTDLTAGVDGYSYVWDTAATTIPDDTKDIEESVVGMTSPELADGNSHYFHIRTVDNAGNWTSTEHLGPFYIDTVGPEDIEIALGGSEETPDGELVIIIEDIDDLSGISEYMISLNPNFAGASWKDFTGEVRYEITGEDGESVTLYFMFRDEAGNESEVFTYQVALELAESGSNIPTIVLIIATLVAILGLKKNKGFLNQQIH
ncbi:MAG: hypothetical protein PHS44_03220 [Candidatus Dojkabacteria bacterium]|nr:hypothetical protein [Candidatus Dojkabacteria bacterium]